MALLGTTKVVKAIINTYASGIVSLWSSYYFATQVCTDCRIFAWCKDVLTDKPHPRFDTKILSKKVRLIRRGSRGGETGEFSPPFFWAPVFLFFSYSFLSLKYWLVLRPRLYGEKLSRVEGSPAHPSYPGRANFSYISLQNLANRLYEKQKAGSARRVTRLAG